MTLSEISGFSVVIPLVVGILYFRNRTNALKILSAFVVIGLVVEVINSLSYYSHINNMPVFHVYTYIEFAVISSIFFLILESRKLKIAIVGMAVLFYTFSAVNLVYWESLSDFNSNQFAVEALIVFLYCIAYYSQLLKNPEFIRLEQHPYFILVSGYFIYFSGTFTLFISSKELLLSSNAGYWLLNSILNILLNITYTIVLWKTRKKSVSY